MGGYGHQLYNFIHSNLNIGKDEFEKIWNEIIYSNHTLREKYNGIWEKIALHDELIKLTPNISENNTAASYAARSTTIFLLLSIIDALANDKYKDFYNWLKDNLKRNEYTLKELGKIYYDQYLNECSGQKNFSKLFEKLIPLGLLNKYEIYFSRNIALYTKLSTDERKRIMEEAKTKFHNATDVDKCHLVARFYYNYYRNLYVHAGQNPSHDPPDWALLRMNQNRNIAFVLHIEPSIGLLSGTITGNIDEHLYQLIKISIAHDFATRYIIT